MKLRIRLAVLLVSSLGVSVPAYAQQFGCYLTYDGIEDRVEIADGVFPLLQYTLSAWVRTAGSVGTQAILSRGEDNISDILPWGFGTLGDGTVYLQIENAANTSSTAYPSVTAVDDGAWHHVAATRITDGTVRLYVNGLLDATHAGTPATGSSSQTVGMGFSYQDSGSGASTKPPLLFWDGSLDELTLWSVALDDAAIADLAASGVPANPAGLVARWELDEGTGQTAADSAVGASHPGTLGAGAGADSSDPVWVCGAKMSTSIYTGGQGCPTQSCVTPTHAFGSATGGGAGLIELSGSTLDFRVSGGTATFTSLGTDPDFEFSDVVYSGTATVDTVGSTHTITSGTALISGTGGDVVCPTPFTFTTSALDVSGTCEGSGSGLSCVLTFELTDPVFDVGGQSRYFVHTINASGAAVAIPSLGPAGLVALALGLLLSAMVSGRRANANHELAVDRSPSR
jgi:hypothetical protein